MDADVEPLARLLLRSAGIASSYIEGISAPIVDVVLAEQRLSSAEDGAAGWVDSNLAGVTRAIATSKTRAALSIEMLCEWHRILVNGSPIPEHYIGSVRQEQGCIGGTSPLGANLVTAPADRPPELLDDRVKYANRRDLDPVAQAAICHAQFEVSHPFGDGNGRVGRVFVAWALTRRLALVVPLPGSVAIAADVGGHSSGLVLFRLGDHGPWIRWFADTVANGNRAQRSLISSVTRINH